MNQAQLSKEKAPYSSVIDDNLMAVDTPHSIKSSAIRSSTSKVLEICSFDEQLVITPDNTVLWLSGNHRRLQVSYADDEIVLQAGWVHFKDYSTESPTLCILHQGSLSLHMLDGTYHRVPLPEEFTSFSPLPTGIVLMGGKLRGSISILIHPLEPLTQPKSLSGPSFAFGAEHIVWSSADVPILATYDNTKEKLALWKISIGEEQDSVVTYKISNTDTFGTSPLHQQPLHASKLDLNSSAALLSSHHSSRRLRLPDGTLSPAAFQSTPQTSSSSTPSSLSTPSKYVPCNIRRIAEYKIPRTKPPTEAHIAHDNQGKELLCFFAPSSGSVYALTLDTEYNHPQWSFTLDGVAAIAAVVATRPKQKDLLVLFTDGRLVLYVGSTPVISDMHGMMGDSIRNIASVQSVDITQLKKLVSLVDAAGNRVTLIGENGLCCRVSLNIAPLDDYIRSAFMSFPEQLWKEWGLDKDATSGDSEREWDALLSIICSREKKSDGSHNGAWARLVEDDYNKKHASAFSWATVGASAQNENSAVNIDNAAVSMPWQKQAIAVLHSEYEDRKLNVLETSILEKMKQVLSQLSAAFAAEEYYEFYSADARVLNIIGLLHDTRTLQPLPNDIQFPLKSRTHVIWTCFSAIRAALVEALQDANSSASALSACAHNVCRCFIENGWTEADIDTLPTEIASVIRHCLNACGNIEIEKLKQPPYSIPLLEQTDDSNFTSDRIELDGMDGIDIQLANTRFSGDCRLLEARRLLASHKPIILRGTQESDNVDQSQQLQWRLVIMAMRTMALPIGRGAFAFCTHRALPTEPLSVPVLSLAATLPERNNAVVKLDLSTANPATSGGATAEITAWPEFHNGVAAGLRLAPAGNLTRTWIVYNKPNEPSYSHAGMLLGLGLTGHLGQLAITDLYRYLSQEDDPTLVGILIGMGAARRGSMDPPISKMLFLHLPTRHPAGYPELEIAPLVQTAALVGLGLLYQGSCHKSIVDILVQEIARSPGPSPPMQSGSRQIDPLYHGVTSNCEAYALAAGMAVGLVTLGKGRNSFGASDSSVESQLKYLMLGGSLSGTVGRRTTLLSTLKTNHGYNDAEMQQQPFFDDSQLQNMGSMYRLGDASNRTAGGVADELAAAQAAAQVIMEGELVNLTVTAPAAAIGLGLMYLQTNDSRIADLFHVPSSNFELDAVAPEHLVLRVMMRSLILWDTIEASEAWVRSHLPPLLQDTLSQIIKRSENWGEDLQTVAQAHCYCIAGSCIALGLRFAGSHDPKAAETIRAFITYLLQAKRDVPEPGGGQYARVNREVIEACVSNCVLALSVVMSGSGDLATFQLLRAMRKRMPAPVEANSISPSIGHPPTSSFTHGSHVAISMAIGFLFLGAGQFRFSSKLESVAALVIALYPRMPCSTVDNRFYLQPLRHLYALAIEPLHPSDANKWTETNAVDLSPFDLLPDEEEDAATVSNFFANLSFNHAN